MRQADGITGTVWLRWNVEKTQEMYNLTVDEAHTFFVGDGQWLVHNVTCSIPTGSTVADVAQGISYKPIQSTVTGETVEEYASAMANGTFDWANANKNQIIEILPARNGDFILQGHHRLLAANLSGVEIPESSIKILEYLNAEWRAPVTDWAKVTWDGMKYWR